MKAIVDLRPQIRTGRVNAWTKDGIRIKIKMRVEFQIEPGVSESPLDDKLVYPLNRIAVRKAVEYTAVRARNGDLQESDWCDGTMGAVAGVMGRHICGRRMDELFTSNGGGVQMLSPIVIKGMINSANTSLTRDAGVRILSLQITEIKIHPAVRQQRVDVWEAQKDSLITQSMGKRRPMRFGLTKRC